MPEPDAPSARTAATWSPVTVSRPISAACDDVWAAISAAGILELAHPFCARNPVIVWPGPGACDEVHYLSGWVYRRDVVAWIEGVGYDLTIGATGEPRSQVSWRIEPDAHGRAALTITIRPRSIDRVPGSLQRPVQSRYVRPMLRRYLDAVVRGFDWYVTTGRPVSDDQFGRHRWFSAR